MHLCFEVSPPHPPGLHTVKVEEEKRQPKFVMHFEEHHSSWTLAQEPFITWGDTHVFYTSQVYTQLTGYFFKKWPTSLWFKTFVPWKVKWISVSTAASLTEVNELRWRWDSWGRESFYKVQALSVQSTLLKEKIFFFFKKEKKKDLERLSSLGKRGCTW